LRHDSAIGRDSMTPRRYSIEPSAATRPTIETRPADSTVMATCLLTGSEQPDIGQRWRVARSIALLSADLRGSYRRSRRSARPGRGFGIVRRFRLVITPDVAPAHESVRMA
jgi:hypothetical protein